MSKYTLMPGRRFRKQGPKYGLKPFGNVCVDFGPKAHRIYRSLDLFADAELRENAREQVFVGNFAGDFAQRGQGVAQVGGQ